MLPKINKPFGFYPGEYVTLKMDKSPETKHLRPVSSIHDQGLIDCLVKVYSRNFGQQNKEIFSNNLDALKEGDKIQLTEVAGSARYKGRGEFSIVDQEKQKVSTKIAKKVGLISEGINMSAMYQYLQAADEDPIDFTGFSLISLYQAPLDALLEEDLLRMESQGLLSYFPVVESPDEMWTHGEGRISKDLIESFMPEPDDPEGLILISGDHKMQKE